jgi:hypothetical protein
MIQAKTIIKNKFWIVEQQGQKIGTLALDDEKYMFKSPAGVKIFNNRTQLEKVIGKTVFEKATTETTIKPTKEIYGYTTSCYPYNPMLDIQRKLPLFTKSPKSKSLYCAGYYIIKFDKGWVRSFCPKLSTIENYTSKGPFVTELEMKGELSRAI